MNLIQIFVFETRSTLSGALLNLADDNNEIQRWYCSNIIHI